MTEAPVSPLRRRMIEDMTIRKFAPRTQEGYIRAVKGFSAFLGASPDRASFEDLRLMCTSCGRSASNACSSSSVRSRLAAGGSRIRTFGPPSENQRFSVSSLWMVDHFESLSPLFDISRIPDSLEPGSPLPAVR